MARRMRGRGGARRQHRAASAPQAQARRLASDTGVRRRPGRARGTRKRDQSRGSAAGFRKTRARPTRGGADAAATGGEGNLAIAEPPRRKAQRAPSQEPRPPETGRAYPPHTTTHAPPYTRFHTHMANPGVTPEHWPWRWVAVPAQKNWGTFRDMQGCAAVGGVLYFSRLRQVRKVRS